MKKLFGLIAVAFTFLFALVGCAQTLSSGSLKSGLQNNGYSVTEFTPAEYEVYSDGAMEASKIPGLQVVLQATKGETVKGALLLFVFDNTNHASDMMTGDYLSMLNNFGERAKDNDQTSTMGSHNNVVWAGSATARNAAGIKI